MRSVYVSEVSRPAHVMAMFNAVIIGLISKRYFKLLKL